MSHFKKKNAVEKIILVLSALLVIATMAYLLYTWIEGASSPPKIVTEIGEISQKGESYEVCLKVRNTGAQTAENVKIEVRAGTTGKAETAEVEFQYLPGRSAAEGRVFFLHPVERSDLRARVKGFKTP